jgi:gamma-glutamyltranspeptidase
MTTVPGGRVLATAVFVCALALVPRAQTGAVGLREPAWAPDGKRLAVVFFDRVWTMLPDGGEASALTGVPGLERDPAWSPDGRRIAFAALRDGGFDLYVVSARGGTPERVTMLDGDERAPSWTPDGRLVFTHRPADGTQWDLFLIDAEAAGADHIPLRLTQSPDDEVQPRVAPDGRRLAFSSNRGTEDGDFDIWVMQLLGRDARAPAGGRGPAVRYVRAAGYDGYPTWSPDGTRLAYYAVRDGIGSTWVGSINPPATGPESIVADRPSPPPVLASRHGGTLAWSPDGRTITIGEIAEREATYNGNPLRDLADAPPLFASGGAYQLWTVLAPRVVDEGARMVSPVAPAPATALIQAFDEVWSTLKRIYYNAGETAPAWDAVRTRHRPRAEQARTAAALEEVIDRMVAEQPLVKPVVTSSHALVVSAHPLASEAGRRVLERGGNVVDAAIAVSFALGVLEPDASGIGGDGQAVLSLTGMPEPTVIEFKDQTPAAATLDNPKVLHGGRLVGDGPAAANIPGVVAGLELLHTAYGSGRLSWSELIAPAIDYAEHGFVLDATLPSSVAEGRQFFQKYQASSRIFLPGGRPPRVGERFVNRDYAATLRTIAQEGASAFYRGSLAKRIAADMEANGGLITLEDLAQYRAVERKPVAGRYRGHVVYTGGPPVGAGVSLLETLQILGNYPARPGANVVKDPDYWHYLIESWKLRDRITRIADPARWAVDYEEHLRPSHAAELFRRIKPGEAARFPEDSEEAFPAERIGSGTSGFVVADAEGNMIAVTQTLSTWGGSFYVSRGLGFLYNNHLRANRATPGVYAQLMPLTRSNTANTPVLVFRDVAAGPVPLAAVASAGNAWIPASTYSIVTAVIDGGMSMQQAVEAPRFLVTRDPVDGLGTAARVEIEDRYPRATLQDLAARGHRFQKVGRKGELRYGYASGALVDVAKRRVEGGADPRRSHAAVAVEGAPALTQ